MSNFDLVTLDASLSYNPNEPKNRQDQMIYIWHCDVDADKENCQEYKTNSKIFVFEKYIRLSLCIGITTKNIILDPVRSLMAPLNKAQKYVFKLITQVNNDYIQHIGRPKEGNAIITLLPKSFVFDVSIKCV